MQFMKNEELYGAVDMPVWVERTAVGSSVQALLQCLPQLRIEGTIVGRLMTRMAEVYLPYISLVSPIYLGRLRG